MARSSLLLALLAVVPVNETRAPIVLVDSAANEITHNECGSVYSTPG